MDYKFKIGDIVRFVNDTTTGSRVGEVIDIYDDGVDQINYEVKYISYFVESPKIKVGGYTEFELEYVQNKKDNPTLEVGNIVKVNDFFNYVGIIKDINKNTCTIKFLWNKEEDNSFEQVFPKRKLIKY